MPPPKFEILLIFSNFLGSYVLSYLANRESTSMPSLLYYISNFVLLAMNRTCTKTL